MLSLSFALSFFCCCFSVFCLFKFEIVFLFSLLCDRFEARCVLRLRVPRRVCCHRRLRLPLGRRFCWLDLVCGLAAVADAVTVAVAVAVDVRCARGRYVIALTLSNLRSCDAHVGSAVDVAVGFYCTINDCTSWPCKGKYAAASAAAAAAAASVSRFFVCFGPATRSLRGQA